VPARPDPAWTGALMAKLSSAVRNWLGTRAGEVAPLAPRMQATRCRPRAMRSCTPSRTRT